MRSRGRSELAGLAGGSPAPAGPGRRAGNLTEIAAALWEAGDPCLAFHDRVELTLDAAAPGRSLQVRLHDAMVECRVMLEKVRITRAARGALHAALARINATLPVPGFLVTSGGVCFFRVAAFADPDGRIDLEVLHLMIDLCRTSVAVHAPALAGAAS